MIRVSDFFDISDFRFKEIFDNLDFAWQALAKISEYLKAIDRFEILGEIMPGAFLEGNNISIGCNSIVEPGVMIRGKVLIGENCEIRQGAYIRGNVIIGDGCVVGHTTEVKNSIFLTGAKAAHFAYVGDSILGRNVNLGAGTKLANFKMDTGDRLVSVCCADGERRQTGLRKMGALIGDGAELGCNCVTMPGTLIGPGALVYPNCTARGTVPADSILKIAQTQQIVAKENR